MKKFHLLAPILFPLLVTAGTDSTSKLSWSVHAHYGFIMPHHNALSYLVNSHIPAASFNLFRRHDGSENWERAFNLPETGVCLHYENFMDPRMGSGIGIQPYIDFPLNKNERFHLKIKVGSGIGFLTRHFERVDNHKNVVIGSTLNSFADLKLSAAFMTGKRGRLETGLSFSHFSNGAFSMPNLGVNYVSLSLGYGILNWPKDLSDAPTTPHDKKVRFWNMLSFGVCEAMPPGGKKYIPVTYIFSAHKSVSNLSRFNMGIELVNNPSNITRAAQDSIYITKGQNFQVGYKLGYEITAGKFALCVEMGVYVYNPYDPNGLFFHRIGSRYQFHEKWMGIFTLKSHWAKADHFEWGIGYRL